MPEAHRVVEKPDAPRDALDTLLYKLEPWLRQQPEWPLLFLAGRAERHRAAKALAKRIYTLPTRKT